MDWSQIRPCPYCGRPPHLYHGVSGRTYGDSLECDRDDCPSPDDQPVWDYTTSSNALRRWNAYAQTKLKTD